VSQNEEEEQQRYQKKLAKLRVEEMARMVNFARARGSSKLLLPFK
jgi:hypothetical protein